MNAADIAVSTRAGRVPGRVDRMACARLSNVAGGEDIGHQLRCSYASSSDEHVVDSAGDVALEAADDLEVAQAL
jgi:hypothetical protein